MPTFSSDGRRRRDYSREAAEHLGGLSLVSVRRNRRGDILAIHFRDAAGGSPLRATAKMGQRYSMRGEVHVWKHAESILEAGRDAFQAVIADQTL